MALDLTLVITADASQAKRALADVESGIKKVEGAARSTSDPINKVTTSVEKLATSEQNLNDIAANGLPVWFNQQKAKTEAAIASDKLSTTETGLMGAMTGLTTATGLSSTALAVYAGAATAVVLGATAVTAVLAKSTTHYFQHAEATRDSREALAELSRGWESFQMMVGGAVLGGSFSIVKPVEALNAALIYTGALISARIMEAKSFLNTLQMVAGALPGGSILQTLMGMGDSAFTSPNRRIATTGAPVPELPETLDWLAGGPARYIASTRPSRAGGRATPGGRAAAPWIPPSMGWTPGLWGLQPGGATYGPGSFLNPATPSYISGLGGWMPGTSVPIGAGPSFGRGFFGNAFGGAAGFGGGLASTVLQSVTGGGSLVGGIGSFVGSGLGGALAKSLTTGIGAIGGLAGGALNAILPGVGALLGPALGWLGGKLFGPTDYELRTRQLGKDRTAATDLLNQPGLQNQWDMLGGNVPFSFDFLKTQAVHDPTRVKGYLDEMLAKTDRLTDAMQRYGITWEEMGDKVQQSQIDTMAKTLIEDFEILTLAGADVTFVIEKMGGSVEAFVQAALRTGSEVPAGMQPMIEKMIEMGLLTDENGEAFTSLEDTGLTFAKTMTQGFDSISKAIDHLAIALGYVPSKLDAITESAIQAGDALGRVKPTGFEDPATGGDTGYDGSQYHRGGYVWPRFHRGGDVPAILQAGEFVMSRAAVNRIGTGRLSAMNSGRSGSAVTAPIVITWNGRTMVELMAQTVLVG